MLPNDLILTKNDIKSITLEQTKAYFTKAMYEGCLDEFSEMFWRVVSELNKERVSLQEGLYRLEEQKRALGRRYDRTRKKYYPSAADKKCLLILIASDYNLLEDQIQWLVDNYSLQRKTKAYKLDIRRNN